MNERQDQQNKNQHPSLIKGGLILSIISLVVLLTSEFFPADAFEGFGLAAGINFLICVSYFLIAVLFNKQVKFKNLYGTKEYQYSLVLFSLSAFTLNKALPVFDHFATWFLVIIIIMHLSIIANIIIGNKNRFSNHIVHFIFGISFAISLYAAIYIAPLYWALAGFWVLGISLHVLVPVFLLLYFTNQFIQALNSSNKGLWSFYTGLGIVLLVIGWHSLEWEKIQNEVHQIKYDFLENNAAGKPEWVLYAQKLPHSKFTERVIESGINFQSATPIFGFDDSINGSRLHDPLIVISSFLMNDLDISRANRIKILQSQYNQRHGAHRRLWSDDNLRVSDTFSNIRLYPNYRLAYFEDVLFIKNTSPNQNSQQEAIFTYTLPDGAVATSMSLWIGDREEKAKLTTREKADKAYREIVGVERRDPALMHWQEGNRVTVTVFPCTPNEPRKLKVGFTIPLHVNDNKLIYNHPTFEGPTAFKAKSFVQIDVISSDQENQLKLPKGFKSNGENSYIYQGQFRENINLEMSTSRLGSHGFRFNNSHYTISKATFNTQSMEFDNIFLDINKSWNIQSVKEILALVKTDVFVFENEFIKVTESNYEQLFSKLSKQAYSLFPLFLLNPNEKNIIISQSTPVTPNLSDLHGSKFRGLLDSYLEEVTIKPTVIELAPTTSTFIQSLKDFQCIELLFANPSKLKEILRGSKIPQVVLKDNEVYLEKSGITITKKEVTDAEQGAPDHLMRLYAYNALMKHNSKLYLTNPNFIDEKEIEGVAEAHVLSPASSLIVLELQADYDRFDIKDSKDSLQNASKSNDGAIPEPHEWVLLSIFLLILLHPIFKRFF